MAEGDKVVTRITAMGIHRVVDGWIQESWLNWDALGLMQQLGG